MRVLVTGANGFVGATLCGHLLESGVEVRGTVRESKDCAAKSVNRAWESCATGDINEFQGWPQVLCGVDVVIHAAARAHVMRDRARDPLAEFRRANAAATARVARFAAESGVRRFVYISSIKVNGEVTGAGQAFRETDAPCPVDPYARSKREAEAALAEVAAPSGLEFTIVRPPLVYGPNVRGNMATLLACLYRGIPLPLGGIRNARTTISLENLCSFLCLCATHSAAAGQTFLIGDEPALSTPELLTFLAAGLAKKAKVYAVPQFLVEHTLALLGARNIYQRLCQSLVVDTRKATERLGWVAPVAPEEALKRTMQWYVENRQDGASVRRE